MVAGPRHTEAGAMIPRIAENRLAIERKQPKVPSLVSSWTHGFTEDSVARGERAQKWAEGVGRRRTLETELIRDTDLARWSTKSLAQGFGVSVLTAARARKALENRGMVPRVMIRRCQDGTDRDLSRLVLREYRTSSADRAQAGQS